MALEVQVYKEIRAYEPKIMFGMSWRQMAAAALAVSLGGLVFAAISVACHQAGMSWSSATDIAAYALFPICVPLAAWGWWRPKGLKPEHYIGYVISNKFSRKVVVYVDEYERLEQSGSAGSARRTKAQKKQEKQYALER